MEGQTLSARLVAGSQGFQRDKPATLQRLESLHNTQQIAEVIRPESISSYILLDSLDILLRLLRFMVFGMLDFTL